MLSDYNQDMLNNIQISKYLDKSSFLAHNDDKWKEELEIYRKMADIRVNANSIYFDGIRRLSDMIDHYEMHAEVWDPRAEFYKLKGNFLHFIHRSFEAVKYLDKALKLEPDNPGYLESKGRTLYHLGYYEQAINVFDDFIKLTPYYWGCYYLKGVSLVRLGRHQEALALYDTAIEKHKFYDIAYKAKVHALCQIGEYEQALEICEFCYELRKDGSHAAWCKVKGLKNAILRRLGRESEIEEDDLHIEESWNKPIVL